MSSEEKRPLTRRALLKGAATLAAAGAAAAAGYVAWRNRTYLFLMGRPPADSQEPKASWSGSQVRSYRPLGSTGILMSDISFGAAGVDNPDVVRRAVERGINYFDNSPDYSNTGSEQTIGKALKSVRHQVFIASKLCT